MSVRDAAEQVLRDDSPAVEIVIRDGVIDGRPSEPCGGFEMIAEKPQHLKLLCKGRSRA